MSRKGLHFDNALDGSPNSGAAVVRPANRSTSTSAASRKMLQCQRKSSPKILQCVKGETHNSARFGADDKTDPFRGRWHTNPHINRPCANERDESPMRAGFRDSAPNR